MGRTSKCNRHPAQGGQNPRLAPRMRKNHRSSKMLEDRLKACPRQHLIRMHAPTGMQLGRNDSRQRPGLQMVRIGKSLRLPRKALIRETNEEARGSRRGSLIRREGKSKMLTLQERLLTDQGIRVKHSKFASWGLRMESLSLASPDSQREMENKYQTLKKRQSP